MGAGRASALSVEEAREALGARASSSHKDPRGWHSRGYLPHFDGGTVTQAITFRLAGSLPKARITELEGLPGSKVRERIEDHLDRGHGEAACAHWSRRSRS